MVQKLIKILHYQRDFFDCGYCPTMVRLFVVRSFCFWLCSEQTFKMSIYNGNSHTALEGFCDMSDAKLCGIFVY
jgi:hypothetical protein